MTTDVFDHGDNILYSHKGDDGKIPYIGRGDSLF
jgi:hypothetical protein